MSISKKKLAKIYQRQKIYPMAFFFFFINLRYLFCKNYLEFIEYRNYILRIVNICHYHQ